MREPPPDGLDGTPAALAATNRGRLACRAGRNPAQNQDRLFGYLEQQLMQDLAAEALFAVIAAKGGSWVEGRLFKDDATASPRVDGCF
jgi:hypothetical protein